MILAAAYFVRLAIAEGWLTPWLQVSFAAAAGGAMIAGSYTLRVRDARYSSLLGAGGVAVLYVAVYGAHVHHELIGSLTAGIATGVVSAISLGLHALFRQTIYIAFALAGTYLTPFLFPREQIHELSVYLGIWSLVYSMYAVWQRQRAVYLGALYAFLIVFAWGWDQQVAVAIGRLPDGRRPPISALDLPRLFAVGVLWFQALVFLTTAVLVSARSKRFLSAALAWAHFPALFLLYGIQYKILEDSRVLGGVLGEDVAAWAGVALALASYAGWWAARRTLKQHPGASLVVVHSFAALVFIHAVYAHIAPEAWRPLAGLSIAAIALGLWRTGARSWPWAIAAIVGFAAGYVELADAWGSARETSGVVARIPLAIGFPAVLYAVALPSSGRRSDSGATWRLPLIACAHALALASAIWLVEEWLGNPQTTIERLWVSLAWAAIGLAWLFLAMAREDRTLARSTLGIFAAFALKVGFSDLDHAAPLVRVGILVVLGLTLYVGGWVYHRVLDPRAALVTRTGS